MRRNGPRRFLHFSWNAARYALGPIAALLIPWVVMQRASRTTWGDTVAVMIVVQFIAHILRWGAREMLPRLFARDAPRVGAIWMSNSVTRTWLLPPALLIVVLIENQMVLAATWLLLLFVNNSFEPLIIWRKRFGASFVIDAAGLAATFGGILWSSDPGLIEVLRSVVLGQLVRALLHALLFRGDLRSPARQDAPAHLARALPFLLIGLSGLLGSRADLYVMGLTADRAMLAEYQVVAGYFVQLQALAGIIAIPFTRELYRMGRHGVARATTRLAALGLLLLVPVGAFGYLLFRRFYGFDIGLGPCVAGCLLGWPVFAYTPMVQTLYKHGREMTMVISGFATAGISAFLTWSLVPQLGITGGLAASATSQFLMLFVVRTVFHRLAPIDR